MVSQITENFVLYMAQIWTKFARSFQFLVVVLDSISLGDTHVPPRIPCLGRFAGTRCVQNASLRERPPTELPYDSIDYY